MNTTSLLEREFEDNICQYLSDHGWLHTPDNTGWDPALALYTPDVLAWLSERYPEEYSKVIPDDDPDKRHKSEQALLKDLAERVLGGKVKPDPRNGRIRGGLLGTLRSGFTYTRIGYRTATFGALAAFPPANPILTSATEAAASNRLRVIRQVRFDQTTNQTIDLVLTVNGIPVVTIELKTDNTQSVDAAKKQYRKDRRPGKNRPLLAPGRCLVHFAVSNDEVYMTTDLRGDETVFLPFNKGTDEGRPGNPSSETGSDTDYLWRQIFSRDLFLRLLRDYALWQPATRDAKGRAVGSDGKLIFPRYHQLRATEAVADDVATHGPGGRYLIWHSAGSGKTKTITWMAHNLIRKHDENGDKIFDSVIIISDRTVLDRNIRDDVSLLQASDGLIVPVGQTGGAKSPELLKALTDGGHIITCTLQTFPEVLKIAEDRAELSGRNWCVIADEAHSSQAGSTALAVRRLLADYTPDDDEPLTGDDLLAARESAISEAVNLTFIAMTATPKARTLRLFGSQEGDGEDARFTAFDTYTMAQAIGEGFILDVLGNYTTYDMLARVRDRIGREEVVDRNEAVSDLVRFVRLHPTSIAQKVEVVVEHFRRNVMHRLDGRAKAMVVTPSRKAAVQWSNAMNSYIAKKGYDEEMKTLVAFSGEVHEGDLSFTEAGMNGRGDTETAFKSEDASKVLIVADKFQTGFDEPLLCAMYVDKSLSGVATVQTLSRLNRIHPGKPTPMVVDFVNDPGQVQADFRAYYSDAFVAGDVDPNSIHSLADELDTAGYYDDEQLQDWAEEYYARATGEKLQKLLSPIKRAWRADYESGEDQRRAKALDFRANLSKYQHAWEFLSQIIDYGDADVAKRAAFSAVLFRNLHLTGSADSEDYSGGVELSGVALTPAEISEDLSLATGEDTALSVPEFSADPVEMPAPVREAFSKVIEEVNERFSAAGITAGSGEKQGFMTSVWGVLEADEEAKAMAAQNTAEQLSKSRKFSQMVIGAVLDSFTSTEQMRDAALSDRDLQASLVKGLAEIAEASQRYGEAPAEG